jgi:hypothetical protein
MTVTKTEPKAKKSAKPKEPKAAKAPKAPKASKPKPPAKPIKLSGLDAAAKVLVDMGVPMNAKQIMAEVLSRKLWETSGATPESGGARRCIGDDLHQWVYREIVPVSPFQVALSSVDARLTRSSSGTPLATSSTIPL